MRKSNALFGFTGGRGKSGLVNRRIEGRSVSGGQRKKIGIARTFLSGGKVLLLDEPFAGLDDASRQRALDFMARDDGSGRAVVVATQHVSCAAAFDRVIVVGCGGKTLVGRHEDLYGSDQAYREFFNSHGEMEAAAINPEARGEEGSDAAIPTSDLTGGLEKTEFVRPFVKYCRILAGLKSRHLIFYLALLPLVTLMPVLLDVIVTGRFSDLYRLPSLHGLSASWTLILYCVATVFYVVIKAAKRWSWVELVNGASRSVFATVIGALLGNRDFSDDSGLFPAAAGRFTKDLDVVDNDILWSLDELIESVLDLVFLLAVVIIMVPLAVFAVPLLYLNLRRAAGYMARKKRSYLQLCRLAERKNGLVQEILHGRTVSDAAWSAGALRRYRLACRRYARSLVTNSKIDRLFFVEANLLAAGALLAMLAGLMAFPVQATGAGLVMLFVFSQKIFNASQYLLGEIAANGLHFMNLDRLLSLIPEGLNRPGRDASPEDPAAEIFSGFRLEGVGLSIRGRRILERLSLDFRRGDKAFVVGPNGAGKSSLLMLINGNYKADAGQLVTMAGPRSVTSLPPHLMTYVPQRSFVCAGTLLENINVGLERTEAAVISRLRECGAAELFEAEFGSFVALNRMIDPGKLNDGQKQFIGLVRAAVDTRPIVLLDEPLAYGSLSCLAFIRQMLESGWKDCIVICVAHDLFLKEYFRKCYDLGRGGQAVLDFHVAAEAR